MDWKKEEIERIELKLKLYGSYTREKEYYENRYSEIVIEEKNNNMPSNAARNLGFTTDDPKHTAVEKMKLEKTSLLNKAGEMEEEIAYLGIDYINVLSEIEKIAIDEIFVRKNSFRGAGNLVDMSKSNLHRLIKKIIEKGTRP